MSDVTMSVTPSAFDSFCVGDILNAKASAVTKTAAQLEGSRTLPPCSVVAVDTNSSLRDALEELELSSVRSVPITDDATGAVVGFFSADLALRQCLAAVGNSELERAVLDKRLGLCLDTRLDSGRHGDGGTIPFACADMPLRAIVDNGFLLYEVHGRSSSGARDNWWYTADVHRLAIVDTTREPTEADDVDVSGFMKMSEIVDIISQLDVMRLLCDAYEKGNPDPQLRRCLDGPVASHAEVPFATFYDAPVGEVLKEMLDRGFSAAVVVERTKPHMDGVADSTLWRAVDNLSIADVRGLRDVSMLRSVDDGGLTVMQFLWHMRGAAAERALLSVSHKSTVFAAAQLMLTHGVHRVWLVDDDEVPVGVVSVTDVLRAAQTAQVAPSSA